jgi:hypothetical protein
MRHAASFTSIGRSASRPQSAFRRGRHRKSLALSSGTALFAVLLAPGTCDSEVVRRNQDIGTQSDQHHIQGPFLQATRLPDAPEPLLQGQRLHASLSDGRRVEITGFDGDVVHAVELDAGSLGAVAPGVRAGGASLRLLPAELVGMQWTESRCEDDACTSVQLRVAAAAPDDTENTMPAHPSNRDTWLYRVEHTTMPSPAEDDWQGACADEPGGDMDMGLFVDGRWAPDGTWQAGGYTFSCPRGAIAKCARSWGYKPWKTLASPAHGPVSLRALHVACTRAARADYCGDGVPHTREGVLVGMSDGYDFNPRAPRGSKAEASFDEHGAVRVHHWRIPALAPACHPARPITGNAAQRIDVWR